MDTRKYLMIPLLAAALISCKQKGTTIEKTDSLKTIDTISKADDRGDALTDRPIDPKQLIVPGKSIGQMSINESMDSVYAVLGRPDSGDAAMGSSLAIWYAKHDTAGYKTSIFARHNYGGKDEVTQHIRKILITSPWFKTAEGVGNGSALKEIKQHYALKQGQGYQAKGKTIGVYYDVSKGISFEIDPATNKCVGILVHRPDDAGGTYINMH